MASKNSQDAISMVQTAEGALQESHNILQRMRELSVQSASDTNETSIDRAALNAEFGQLIKELDDTADKTVFNDQKLLNGDFAKNTTTATTSNTKVGLSWAATKVGASEIDKTTGAGGYKVTITSKLSSSPVKAAAGTVSITIAPAMTSTDGKVGVTFKEGTATRASLNGVWDLNISDGQAVATNRRTGEKVSAQLASTDSINGEAKLKFGELGEITISGGSATVPLEKSNFTGLTGQFSVSNAVDEKQAEYIHVAQMGVDEVVLETGQTNINFVNSGISVKLKDSIVVNEAEGDSSKAVQNVAGKGVTTFTIEVTKTAGKALVVQTGANEGDNLAISMERMNSYALGVRASNIGNRMDASVAITQVNTAINRVSTQRAELGALQNRLEHKIANLDTSAENLTAAESRIRDVDMAKEMTTFMKNNILGQASTAMLAQANSLPQGVLQLLG
jgi:flagellin